ncbi:hypothetical protein C8E87_4472 [Paractinoplanes brasiliensis]|uniref:Ferritin-like protein n=2 Tax=Paractinoplanes brasiliensis TaxID=52695 RepID=A0A4R6JVI0_9ACTN|nr:hypothetical protein C8E87_4472 [Actinoplanes brasiliensis]GID25825.1 hypothetical protein Abr02nite_08080 [Actinoplanes brasiliensis]
MVLTGAVRMSITGYSRRRVLGAVAAGLTTASLSGCGLFDDEPEPPDPPDPLQPLLDEAVALAASYDRAILAQPGLATRLTPLADDHRAHAAELARLIGEPPPSAGPSASAAAGAPAETIATLRTAEQAAQKSAVAACLAAPADRTALVGSIAACRATHAEALR